MRFRLSRSPFFRCAATAIVAALTQAPAPAAALSFSAALFSADGEGRSPAYRDAQSALDQARWEEAAQRFATVAEQKNADSDAALYWKAYAEEKLGRRSEALQTLKNLRLSYPKSVWLDDADALEVALTGGAPRGGPVTAGPRTSGPVTAGPVVAGGGSSAEEDLQLYALDGLMQMDSARALPILEEILAGNRSLQVKQRALFVLSQSDEPRARTLLVETARSGRPAELQIEAVRSLGIAGDPDDIRVLSELYRSAPAKETRAAILEAFMIAGEEKPILEAARGEGDPQLRGKAIELLGAAGGDDELVALYAATADRELRGKIIQGLMIAGNAKALIGLLRQEKDPELKRQIVQHLSLMDDDEAMNEIERLLTEKP